MFGCERMFRDRRSIYRQLLISPPRVYNKLIISECEYNNMLGFFKNKQNRIKLRNVAQNSLVDYGIQKMSELDSRILSLRKKHSREAFCKPGCNDCCSDYFYISQTEYFILRQALISRNELPELKNAAQELMRILEREYPEELHRLIADVDINKAFTGNQEYLRQLAACPLNDLKSGLCRFYEHRPITCRIYGNNVERGCCDNIKEDFKMPDGTVDQTKIEKYLIDEWICEDTCGLYFDYFPLMSNKEPVIKDGNLVPCFIRPLPLIYWLSNDDEWIEKYTDAITLDIEEYNAKYYSIN